MNIEDKLRSITDDKGVNLYDHLMNTLAKMLNDHPQNPYELFENYSVNVKQLGFQYNDIKNFEMETKLRDSYEDVQEYLESFAQYFVIFC